MPEGIAMFFMVEILSILEAVHNCNIIHADIKPDNFLVQAIPKSNPCDDIFSEDTKCLKLIDFGRSIDMKAFPEGTTFTEVVSFLQYCMYVVIVCSRLISIVKDLHLHFICFHHKYLCSLENSVCLMFSLYNTMHTQFTIARSISYSCWVVHEGYMRESMLWPATGWSYLLEGMHFTVFYCFFTNTQTT